MSILIVPEKVNLDNLEASSPQKVFNWVAYNLLVQGKKSINIVPGFIGSNCAYRGKDGSKCAGGWLISDCQYSLELEALDWISLALEKRVPSAHITLVYNLQKIHDDFEPTVWANELIHLANRENLDAEIVRAIQ